MIPDRVDRGRAQSATPRDAGVLAAQRHVSPGSHSCAITAAPLAQIMKERQPRNAASLNPTAAVSTPHRINTHGLTMACIVGSALQALTKTRGVILCAPRVVLASTRAQRA